MCVCGGGGQVKLSVVSRGGMVGHCIFIIF